MFETIADDMMRITVLILIVVEERIGFIHYENNDDHVGNGVLILIVVEERIGLAGVCCLYRHHRPVLILIVVEERIGCVNMVGMDIQKMS